MVRSVCRLSRIAGGFFLEQHIEHGLGLLGSVLHCLEPLTEQLE
jgi:hypothetical protein